MKGAADVTPVWLAASTDGFVARLGGGGGFGVTTAVAALLYNSSSDELGEEDRECGAESWSKGFIEPLFPELLVGCGISKTPPGCSGESHQACSSELGGGTTKKIRPLAGNEEYHIRFANGSWNVKATSFSSSFSSGRVDDTPWSNIFESAAFFTGSTMRTSARKICKERLSQGPWRIHNCDTPQRPDDDLIPSARHASKRTNPTDFHDRVYGLMESEVKVVNNYSC